MPTDKGGENWVENWGWLATSLFTAVQKDTKTLPCPGERVGCPLMLKQLSIMLMTVLSGPVCPQQGLILWPHPHLWADLLFSLQTAGKGSSEGQEDGGPHTHPETWAFLLGEGPLSLSFKGLKDNSKSAFSFVFEITNIITTERCCDLFQGQSQA